MNNRKKEFVNVSSSETRYAIIFDCKKSKNLMNEIFYLKK